MGALNGRITSSSIAPSTYTEPPNTQTLVVQWAFCSPFFGGLAPGSWATSGRPAHATPMYALGDESRYVTSCRPFISCIELSAVIAIEVVSAVSCFKLSHCLIRIHCFMIFIWWFVEVMSCLLLFVARRSCSLRYVNAELPTGEPRQQSYFFGSQCVLAQGHAYTLAGLILPVLG